MHYDLDPISMYNNNVYLRPQSVLQIIYNILITHIHRRVNINNKSTHEHMYY